MRKLSLLLTLAVFAACSAGENRPGTPPTEPAAEPTRVRPSSSATSVRPTSPDPSPSGAELARLNAALIDAAWANDLPAARRLIARGADVNHTDETTQSAYLIATSEGHRDLLDLTLAAGARVDAKDRFNGTGLIRAADRGHWDIAGRLVRAGIDLDHVNNLGWTALHEAVILGDGSQRYLDTVRVLLAAGVDATVPAVEDGFTAREHAEQRGYGDIASLLARADRPVRRPEAALLAAARAGDADNASLALRAGAQVDARDGDRRTPLLHAVIGDVGQVARVLVALGADPDAVDAQSDTPWLVTGVTGSVPMGRLLLTADPDVTLRNRYGGVSIIPAAERGHAAYVRWAVRATDIDVDHVNDLGWTALLEAVLLGEGTTPWQRIVRTLLAAGADPQLADRDGVTALEHARRRGFEEIARLLAR
ncbi:ankyrin repeat protein [Nocardioides sp. CF8]|uniref:ankyrin repeat domain-containing protein n=1 Tax=Nocardioides sp. CF8 TaxID=110319 RepID=UPI00032E9D72|nr:ankyrin repeat domain-containing protein [Nocardioides sp. CF8]EON25367.1 ankyrin repeat protein [Nocardioides sp. CF8]